MMDNNRLRIAILVLVAYSAVLRTEAGQSSGAGGQPEEDRRHSGSNGGNWRSSIYPGQADVIVDNDLDSDFYRYQSRPVFRPYQRLQRPLSAPRVPAGADADAAEYDADANKDLENMPFGVQNVRSVLPARPTRTRPATPAPPRITFQSLCPSRRETVFLNLVQAEYEYRPNHYDEVYCMHPYTAHREYVPQTNKVEEGVCGDVGFNCIQLNRTIFLTRKAAGSDCWESETRLIPAGCECMWPKHHFGDIGGHH